MKIKSHELVHKTKTGHRGEVRFSISGEGMPEGEKGKVAAVTHIVAVNLARCLKDGLWKLGYGEVDVE